MLASLVDVRALPAAAARVRVARSVLLVAGIVAVSATARWLLGLGHVVPYYFSDEYVYSALARGLADHGSPIVRGELAPFPALLEPLQTALLYALADVHTAFRLTQALHAIEVSLAAVPVFLLARHLRLPPALCVWSAILAVSGPALFWGAFITADGVGYTLALTALYLSVRALSTPSPVLQVAFVVAAALAIFARTQYFVLIPVYVIVAALVERDGRRLARGHGVVLAVAAGAALAVGAAAVAGVLGPYAGVLGLAPSAHALASATAFNLLVVALGSGGVLIPGALVGLDAALSAPRDRSEHSFALLALLLGASFVGLTAFVAGLGGPPVIERYLGVLLALVPLLFGLWLRREMPRPGVVTALTALLVVAVLITPLARLEPTHSPTLLGLAELGALRHGIVFAGVVLALAGVAAAVPWLGGRLVATVLSAAVATTAALSIGAAAFDWRNAHEVRDGRLPVHADWIDRAHVGPVALLHGPYAGRAEGLQQLFWNRSLDRVLMLRGADPLDFFATTDVRISPHGEVVGREGAIRRPLLVPRQGSTFTFARGKVLGQVRDFELVGGGGGVRLATATFGRYRDGWLRGDASIAAWPEQAGARLALRLRLPQNVGEPVQVTFASGAFRRGMTVSPGETVEVALPLGEGPSRWSIRARPTIDVGGRTVAVLSSRPVLERAGS